MAVLGFCDVCGAFITRGMAPMQSYRGPVSKEVYHMCGECEIKVEAYVTALAEKNMPETFPEVKVAIPEPEVVEDEKD